MGLPELWTMLGPGLAGAVFGGGWWFWVDAVVCSDIRVTFLHYLPGFRNSGSLGESLDGLPLDPAVGHALVVAPEDFVMVMSLLASHEFADLRVS